MPGWELMERTQRGPGTNLLRDLLIAWLPVLAWMALIFYLSAQGSLGGQKWPPIFQALRKSAHIVEYGTLGVLAARAIVLTVRARGETLTRTLYLRAWWLGAAFSTLYALTDEFHQSFVPGRGAHIEDVLIDALSAIGITGIWYIWRNRTSKPL